MNNKRRKTISDTVVTLSSCLDTLQDVAYDEEEAMCGMPESLQNSERYEQSERDCDILRDAVEALRNEVIEPLGNIE